MKGLLLVLGLMCASTSAAERFPLQCFYAPDEPQGELQPQSTCAAREGQLVRIAPRHLQRMAYDSHGLAQAAIDGQHYYVSKDGRVLAVITYDNGPDPFAEGLVRSLLDGKIAYFDSTLREAFSARFDWGFPFRDGKAVVCLGCSIAPPDDDGHKAVVGGLWGCVDAKGRVVIPIVHARSELHSCAS